MKKWVWMFVVLLVVAELFLWREMNQHIHSGGLAPSSAFIVDRAGQAMIDRLYAREVSPEEQKWLDRYHFSLLAPETAQLHEAHYGNPILIAYQELTAHPELADTVKKWIGQGIELYFYGEEIVPAELERKLGITLEHKSSEKAASSDTGMAYQMIAYEQHEERKQTRVMFVTIQVVLEKESFRQYDGPSAHADSYLRTMLRDATRAGNGMETRNSIAWSAEFKEPLVLGEDLLCTLFVSKADGNLALVADLSSHVDVYQHRNEVDQEYDYFFLTHGTQVTAYNESQVKRIEIVHDKPFDDVKLLEYGPFSQKGNTFDAMIYRDLHWSYGNQQPTELKADYVMSADRVSWTVTSRWWKRGLGSKSLVVPGSFWASKGSYLGVDVTQRAQIGYQFNKYWMGIPRAVRYDYETGYVQP